METVTIKRYGQHRADVAVRTPEELENALNEIDRTHRDHPIIIDLINDTGECLTLGLGAPETALTLAPASRDSCRESIGNTEATPDDHLVFYYGGQWTGVLKSKSVLIAAAREVVRQWIRDGSAGSTVKWKDCW